MTRQFHKTLFFTKVPLQGCYRYKDIFQIYPAVFENLPKSKLQKHYPNILEFWTSDTDKISAPADFASSMYLKKYYEESVPYIIKQDKILSLLTAFTNNLFFRYIDTDGSWGLPIYYDNPGDEANGWSSKWCLPLFTFPKLPQQFIIEKFTDLAIPEVGKIDHKSFYTNKPNLDTDSKIPIIFPVTINELFDSYFSLTTEIVSIIDASISYMVSAIELKDQKKTLSLLASFTAIETLINLEFRNINAKKCEQCNQLKYSISQKFREFLLHYIGNTNLNKKKFNSYYTLRCKIVHTGRQLKTELLFADGTQDEQLEELMIRVEILQMSKLAIVNWLLTKNRISPQKQE